VPSRREHLVLAGEQIEQTFRWARAATFIDCQCDGRQACCRGRDGHRSPARDGRRVALDLRGFE